MSTLLAGRLHRQETAEVRLVNPHEVRYQEPVGHYPDGLLVAEQRLEDLLARLERERLDADRLYNDALTAVDRAIQGLPSLPGPPRPFDSARLPEINAAWDILPSGPPPDDRSWKGRLRGFIWRLVGPPRPAAGHFAV